jgi:transposase-like protein
MAANRAGYDRAAKHFGMSRSTVGWWVREARNNPQPGRRSASLNPPSLTVIQSPPPPAKTAIPLTTQRRARRLITLALRRLAEVLPTADVRECASVITTLTDRFDLFGDLNDRSRLPAHADSTTAEGRAALMADLEVLPADVLQEALRKAQSA